VCVLRVDRGTPVKQQTKHHSSSKHEDIARPKKEDAEQREKKIEKQGGKIRSKAQMTKRALGDIVKKEGNLRERANGHIFLSTQAASKQERNNMKAKG